MHCPSQECHLKNIAPLLSNKNHVSVISIDNCQWQWFVFSMPHFAGYGITYIHTTETQRNWACAKQGRRVTRAPHNTGYKTIGSAATIIIATQADTYTSRIIIAKSDPKNCDSEEDIWCLQKTADVLPGQGAIATASTTSTNRRSTNMADRNLTLPSKRPTRNILPTAKV